MVRRMLGVPPLPAQVRKLLSCCVAALPRVSCWPHGIAGIQHQSLRLSLSPAQGHASSPTASNVAQGTGVPTSPSVRPHASSAAIRLRHRPRQQGSAKAHSPSSSETGPVHAAHASQRDAASGKASRPQMKGPAARSGTTAALHQGKPVMDAVRPAPKRPASPASMDSPSAAGAPQTTSLSEPVQPATASKPHADLAACKAADPEPMQAGPSAPAAAAADAAHASGQHISPAMDLKQPERRSPEHCLGQLMPSLAAADPPLNEPDSGLALSQQPDMRPPHAAVASSTLQLDQPANTRKQPASPAGPRSSSPCQTRPGPTLPAAETPPMRLSTDSGLAKVQLAHKRSSEILHSAQAQLDPQISKRPKHVSFSAGVQAGHSMGQAVQAEPAKAGSATVPMLRLPSAQQASQQLLQPKALSARVRPAAPQRSTSARAQSARAIPSAPRQAVQPATVSARTQPSAPPQAPKLRAASALPQPSLSKAASARMQPAAPQHSTQSRAQSAQAWPSRPQQARLLVILERKMPCSPCASPMQLRPSPKQPAPYAVRLFAGSQ